MKRYTILLSILLVAYFFSCAKTDSDTTPPVISAVMINSNDTIVVRPGDTIRINEDEEESLKTIVLGRKLKFKALFSDDKMLSSYRIRIEVHPDNLGVEDDSVYYVKRRWSEIFGLKEYAFDIRPNDNILIPENFDYTGKSPITNADTTMKRPVREGLYNLQVLLIDAAGNGDSVVQKVTLLKRKTIIDNHSK